MGRVVDITDKLTFEEKPAIVVAGKKIEVNDDAPTMLKILGLIETEEDTSVEDINKIYNMIFPEESRQAVDELHLSTKDWMTLVQAGIGLIIGEVDTQPGGAAAHTTTYSTTGT